MAQKPETRFRNNTVIPALKKIPGLSYESIQQQSIRGTPDLIICFRGYFIAWELKVGDNEAQPLQSYKLSKWRAAGGIARTVYPETLEEAIKELLCLQP